MTNPWINVRAIVEMSKFAVNYRENQTYAQPGSGKISRSRLIIFFFGAMFLSSHRETLRSSSIEFLSYVKRDMRII